MKEIAVFDDKNYCENWMWHRRYAVRAIIARNHKIALLRNIEEGYYEFPGGGIEHNETHPETLIREVLEETGLKVIPDSIKEFGFVREIRKSRTSSLEVFDQFSYYYFAEVASEVFEKALEVHEHRYSLVWVDILDAFQTNSKLGLNYERKFILREAAVLYELINYFQIY